jgi:hypothetical protein
MNWLRSIFHRHEWEPRGVEQLWQFSAIRCPLTEVLYVCACGESKTQEMTGHWTLEQLLPGASPQTAAEFMKELGVKP